jgi:hypothetical protein
MSFYLPIQAVALANQKLLGIPSVSVTCIKLPFFMYLKVKTSFSRKYTLALLLFAIQEQHVIA